MLLKCAIALICVFLVITVYCPSRHARHYEYVKDEDVLQELVQSETGRSNLKKCTYAHLLANKTEIEDDYIYRSKAYDGVLRGGEYSPNDCAPIFKTAILVPYRNRKRQLEIFLDYMHEFLQAQKLHYRIFIVEQNNTLPFNRALMLNVGAKVAMDMAYSCLILHDVDLFPMNLANIYACSKQPRHMSCSVDTFRYNLPYLALFGGVVAIQSEHYKQVNGMSNLFYGWGAEDDDFYQRLEAHGQLPCRFSPKISKYVMLNHKKEQPSEQRMDKLKYGLKRHKLDGLNTLPDNYLIKFEPLYTHILA